MPVERIIAAATAIIDGDGAEVLSMRTLAQRLDSGTATLYRHFRSRAQLIALVIDTVLGETDTDAAAARDMPWRQAVESGARTLFETFRKHPHIARLLAERIPMGPNAMRQREVMLAALLNAGFSPELAAQAYATLARLVLGFGVQIGDRPADENSELTETWHTPDPQPYPATVAAAEHLPVGLDREFSLALDLVLDGLTQLLDDA